MFRNSIRFLVVLVVLAGNSFAASTDTLSAADFINVLGKIDSSYNGSQKFKVAITYTSYSTSSSLSVGERQKGFLWKDGNKYFSAVGDLYTLRTPVVFAVIDSLEKNIYVRDTATSLFVFENLSPEIINEYSKLITSQVDPFGKKYTVILNEGLSINKYDFILNEDKSVKKIVMYYSFIREEGFADETKKVQYEPRLEMEFGNYEKNIVFKEDDFNIDKWLLSYNGVPYSIKKESQFKFNDQRVPRKK